MEWLKERDLAEFTSEDWSAFLVHESAEEFFCQWSPSPDQLRSYARQLVNNVPSATGCANVFKLAEKLKWSHHQMFGVYRWIEDHVYFDTGNYMFHSSDGYQYVQIVLTSQAYEDLSGEESPEEKRQKMRFHVLRTLYEEVGDNERKTVGIDVLLSKSEVSAEELENILMYLSRKGLVFLNSGGAIITHQGIDAAERNHPLPGVNINIDASRPVNIGTVTNSSLVAHSSNVSMVSNIQPAQDVLDEVRRFAEQLQKAIAEESTLAELKADLDTLNTQLEAKDPHQGILKYVIEKVRSRIVDRAGDAVFASLLLAADTALNLLPQ